MAGVRETVSLFGVLAALLVCSDGLTTVSTFTTVSITLPESTTPHSWHHLLRPGRNQVHSGMKCTLTGDAKVMEYFSVFPGTCLLILNKPLQTDQNNTLLYKVNVKYRNSSDPGSEFFELVNIRVPRNLRAPQFVSSVYTTSVYDFEATGTSVIRVTAIDQDLSAPNNEIRYSLSRGDVEYFRIDSLTGLITINKPLPGDIAQSNRYKLTAIASDNGSPPRSSTVPVLVTVSRNTAPVFPQSQYRRPVAESAPVLEYTIITVAATDPDSPKIPNGQLTYSIDTPEARRIFLINTTTGAIVPRIDLRHVSPNWNFVVRVSDAGTPPLSAMTTVGITIMKDPLPKFTPPEIHMTIPVDFAVNRTVTTVNALYPINGVAMVYKLRDDSGASFFTINSKTGKLILSKSLSEDVHKSIVYVLRIVAYPTDNTNAISEGKVVIQVIRNPNTPVFSQTQSVVAINENQLVGTVVATMTATDPDTGVSGVVEYSIGQTIPSTTSDLFFVNPRNGAVHIISSLEHSTETQYQLTVVATDHGTPPKDSSSELKIMISRNPNAPMFQSSQYVMAIPASYSTGVTLLTVLASDSDGDAVTYSIVDDPPDSFFFKIDAKTGDVSLQNSLIHDSKDVYNIRVIATDDASSPRTSTASVRVTVIRNLNPPVFASDTPLLVNISEYMLPLAVVMKLSASDRDDNTTLAGQIRYTMSDVTPQTAKNYFIVSPTTGEIVLTAPLTSTSQDLLQLTVVVSDLATNPRSDSIKVGVRVIRNLHAPVFTPGPRSFNMSESDPIGTVVTTVAATDDDSQSPFNRNSPNSEVQYSFTNTNSLAARMFGISDTGEVYVKQPLILNTNADTTFTLGVKAEDQGQSRKSDIINITINVTPTPKLTQGVGFIQPEYFLKLMENTVHRTLLFLSVVNQGGRPVRCSILNTDPVGATGLFTVEADTDHKNCNLKLVPGQTLDRERMDSISLVVEVKEEGGRIARDVAAYNSWSQAKIDIMILDANDERPEFEYPAYPSPGYAPDVYFALVAEDTRPLTAVIRVQAVDKDAETNALVRYHSFVTQPLSFMVTADDGVVLTTREFTSSSPRQYRIPIIASDSPLNGVANNQTTQVIVNLVKEENRFIMTISKSIDVIIPQKDDIQKQLQTAYGNLVLIEQLRSTRTRDRGNHEHIDTNSTDLVFVIVGNKADNYYLKTNKVIQPTQAVTHPTQG